MLTVHRKWTWCILGDGSESKLGVSVLSSSYQSRTERESERERERERLRLSVRSSAIDKDWDLLVAFTGTMESKYHPRGICPRQLCGTWIPHGYPSCSDVRSLLDVGGRDGSRSAIYPGVLYAYFLTDYYVTHPRYVQIRKNVGSVFRLTRHY